MLKHPSIVTFKSIDDLKVLKDWFYNFNETTDHRPRAVDRVKALSSRGKIPHCIESTALLTSICLQDSSTNDSNIIQLSYSMALIRFVNGLLDPLQQSNFAIPLHQLAKTVNVPNFFVELRHMSTHERLPSIEILRIGCKQALCWLYDNYWNLIQDLDTENSEDDELLQTDLDTIQTQIQQFQTNEQLIISNLKTYKRIRKQNLDVIYKYGNSSDIGTKYWDAVGGIKQRLPEIPEAIVQVLVYRQFLLKPQKDAKYIALLYKLYAPLFDELGFEFKWRLFKHFCKLMAPLTTQDQYLYKKLQFEYQSLQVKYWVLELVKGFKSLKPPQMGPFTSKSTLISAVLDILQETHDVFLWENLEPILPSPRVAHIHQTLITTTKLNHYENVASLDAILGTTPPSPKRQKTHVFFDPHPDWQPRPFGSLI